MDRRQIVNGCKRGDPASVEALYNGYSARMMRICRHYVDSQEVAEDLLHDAFIVILSSIGKLRNPERLEAWMGVIVKNMALDYLKESKHFIRQAEDLDIEDVPDEMQYPVPPYDDLMALIDRLPEQYGKVFRLSVLEGLSHKEIGALLHIGERSSSSNLFRARQFLQKAIKSYWLALLLLVGAIIAPLVLHRTSNTGCPDGGPIAGPVSVDTVSTFHPADSLPIPIPPENLRRRKLAESQGQEIAAEERVREVLDLKPLPGCVSRITVQAPAVLPQRLFTAAGAHGQDHLAGKQSAPKGAVLGLLPSFSALPAALFEKIDAPIAMDPNKIPEESVEYERPFSIGLSASIGLTGRLSILTGLEYTRLKSTHTAVRDNLSAIYEQKIHYVGVPLGLSYAVWSRDKLKVNASAFGKLEVPLAATFTYTGISAFQAPVQWSVGAGMGLQYNVLPWMGLYVEPQIRYYFDTGSDFRTIRQARPLEFAVPFGVRLTF